MVKRLVRQRWLLQPLFRTVARPLFVRQVLAQAYPSGANVDQDLIELLLRPSRQAGAVESFRGFVNLFRDHMAPELLPQLDLPVRLLWGFIVGAVAHAGQLMQFLDAAVALGPAARFSDRFPGVGSTPQQAHGQFKLRQ